MEPRKCLMAAIKPIERPKNTTHSYHREIIQKMHIIAQQNGRDLLEDVLRIISVYFTHGTNIEKTLDSSLTTDETKRILIILKTIYELKSITQLNECTITMSRVAEAFPHVSLVIADMLNNDPGGPGLRFCVTSKDLGADVHFHFKMNYFPSLIDVESCWKAQIALLVHNLCHAKSILKTSGAKDIGPAFGLSCKVSTRMMKECLAPADARKKFTEFIIESFEFSAEALSHVWDQVIGEKKILSFGTLITPFHEQVLSQQPLNLFKWQKILEQYAPDPGKLEMINSKYQQMVIYMLWSWWPYSFCSIIL